MGHRHQPLAVVGEPGSVAEEEGGGAGDNAGESVPKTRPVMSDPDHRDDARQILSVMLAATQRERARADQFYTRARNLLAYTTALFGVVQAAFLTNLGRERGGELLITASERHEVAYAAGTALILLVISAICLFAFADRAQSVDTVEGHDLLEVWLDPTGKYSDEPTLATVLGKVATEEESWAAANRSRASANAVLAWVVGGTALAGVAELALLYSALS